MIDVEMTASSAAKYLEEELNTGLSYSTYLADMRRHRRECRIPFHRNEKRWAMYYRSDLDKFIAEERAGMRSLRHDYLVERKSSPLSSWLPPERRIAPIAH